MTPRPIQLNDSELEANPAPILAQLRLRLKENPKTRDFPLENSFLLKFLRSRCFDLNKSFQVLVSYLEKISERPEIFTWSSEIKKAIDACIYNHYQIKNATGERILLIYPGKWNPSQVNIMQLIKLSIIGQEINLMDETTQKSGYIVVVNMSGLSLSHVYQCGMSNAKLISDLTDRCMPIRVNRIHIVFENRLTDIAYSLFKPFLDQELKNKITFHGRNLDSLHKYVPASCLPSVFGGTNADPDPEAIWRSITEKRDALEIMWDKLKASKNFNNNYK